MATDEQADGVFDVAVLLAKYGIDNNSESALRSAVSRGYYSVFLAAHRRSGCNDSNELHSKVIQACNKALGHMRTDRLRWMRELRVAADYFIDAKPLSNADLANDLSDWNENWKYIELWAPILREHLKRWKP